jgi:hypothetical protein
MGAARIMLYISFAWTTAAFLAGAKCRTRRYWNDDYAEKFIRIYEKHEPVGALDKLFRAGGKKIGELLLTERPFKQATGLMTEQDFIDEGLSWMQRQGILIKGQSPQQFFREWKLINDTPWVISFKSISQSNNQGQQGEE